MPQSNSHSGLRLRYLCYLLAVLVLGIATVIYRGSAFEWIVNQLGGMLYVLAGVFFVLALFPRLRPLSVCVAVFLGTCAIECLQLWQLPFLQTARETLPGRLVLGSTFAWSDFPSYVVGAVIALGLIRWNGFRSRIMER